MTTAALSHHIDRLLTVPTNARLYEVDPVVARAEFGLGDRELDALVAIGLSTTDEAGAPRFSRADLHYLGLRLGSAVPHLMAARLQARALERASQAESNGFSLRYLLRENSPELPAILQLPGDRRLQVTLSSAFPTEPYPTSTPGRVRSDASLAKRLVDDVVDMEWYDGAVGPTDLSLAASISLTDCTTVMRLLEAAAERSGVESRRAYGFILSQPYATPHNWLEFRVDEGWVALSPLLLSVLRDFGGLRVHEWPLWRSPGSLLVRLGSDELAAPIAVNARDGALLSPVVLVQRRAS